jgi:uncharacterized protein involved in exopolysaccharide biosynthesis
MLTNIPDQYEEEDAISLIDLLLVFARHKGKIVVIPFLVSCVVAAYSLMVSEIYTASTTIIPTDRKESRYMSMGGASSPLVGLAGEVIGRGDAGVLITMVGSRRVQDQIIAKRNLRKGKDGGELSMETTRRKLAGATIALLGRKDGVITISVKDEDPEKAATLANDYVKELERLSQELALTKTSQRRAFLEKQLTKVKEGLQKAEIAYKDFQKKSGLIQSGQGSAIINAIASLRAQISADEVGLGSLRLSATEENPQVQLLTTRLAELKKQLKKLEQDNPEDKIGSLFQSTSRLPEVGLEYSRLMRNLRYSETINRLLSEQYQLAQVEEAQNAPILRVLDAAIPPEQRTSPKRTQMVLMAIAASGFAMCLLVFLLEAKNQAETDPKQAGKMVDLKKSLWRI